jgi:hypothetical protein
MLSLVPFVDNPERKPNEQRVIHRSTQCYFASIAQGATYAFVIAAIAACNADPS